VRYEIDPKNPYPKRFTGHVRAVLKGGRAVEERQDHLRGGADEPLTRQEIEAKFAANARHGRWSAAQIEAALALARRLFDGAVDLQALRG
jgi:2-methylcitrate dehydratase PrpD